jgi:hypothetical protein
MLGLRCADSGVYDGSSDAPACDAVSTLFDIGLINAMSGVTSRLRGLMLIDRAPEVAVNGGKELTNAPRDVVLGGGGLTAPPLGPKKHINREKRRLATYSSLLIHSSEVLKCSHRCGFWCAIPDPDQASRERRVSN